MEYKNELIGELSDNIGYFEMLDFLGMTDEIDDWFDEFLSNLTDDILIEMFEDNCCDYNRFLEMHNYQNL